MSRTIRRRPSGYNPGEKHYEKAKAAHVPGIHPGDWWCHLHEFYDFRKAHWVHGRDMQRRVSCGHPTSHSSHGYSTRDEVWGAVGKRQAKFTAGRYRRLQGKAACKEDQ